MSVLDGDSIIITNCCIQHHNLLVLNVPVVTTAVLGQAGCVHMETEEWSHHCQGQNDLLRGSSIGASVSAVDVDHTASQPILQLVPELPDCPL